MKPIFVLLLPLATLLVDCATLDALPDATCGNGVVDANEDCDSFPVGSHTQACGAPTSGPTACRLLCGKQSNGDTDVCPDGWGCGVDGICRQPTGSFDPAAAPVSAGVTTMLVGDFDGDGRQDVLGSSAAISKGRIHYFKDGAAPDVVPLPGVLAAPLVFDFDGDGRSDIAFGYTFRGATEVDDGILELDASGGFAIIEGQTDRAVVAKLFPTLTKTQFDAFLVPLHLAAANDVPTSATANPVIGYATTLNAANQTVTVLSSLDADFGYLKPITIGAGDALASPPIATSMFDLLGDLSTCGEVVVPLQSKLLVYSPCARVAKTVSWTNREPQTFTIPNETITRVFSADVDNDGHDDLIVGTMASDGPHVHVAFSDGLTLSFARPTPQTLIDVPLAAGLLDSDTQVDFVIPEGVLFSSVMTAAAAKDGGADAGPLTDQQLAWTLAPVPTKKWTVAQVADVNHDGLLDVIGASQYEPDIDVLEGTKSLNMPPFSVQTSGTVTNLAIGDFDFDRTNDIAFVQAAAASTQREVAIAYGRALAMPPEAPSTAGRLDGIRQVLAGPTGVSIATSGSVAGGLPTFSFAVLLSSADRQPVAPLFFSDVTDPVKNPAQTRRELITRALVAAPNGTSVDLVGIVSRQDYLRQSGVATGLPAYQLWDAAGTGAVAFNPPVEAFELTGVAAVDKQTDEFLVQTAAADLDGDGKTELVAISPDASGNGVTYRVVNRSAAALPAATPIAGKAPLGNQRARLLDVDADGKLDLVTILFDVASKTQSANVLFGDGRGGFGAATMLTLPVPTGADPQAYGALDFTLMTTGGAGALGGGSRRTELVIITSSHLFRVQVGPDRTPEIADATALFDTIVSGSAVVAGDFNGDGVPDLAIADQGAIRIASQQPRLR